MNLFLVMCVSMLLAGKGDDPKIVYDPRLELQNLFAPSCDKVKGNWRLVAQEASDQSGNIKDKTTAEEVRRALLGYHVRYFVRDVLRVCHMKPSDIPGESEESFRLYEQAYRRKAKRDKERDEQRYRERRSTSVGNRLANR